MALTDAEKKELAQLEKEAGLSSQEQSELDSLEAEVGQAGAGLRFQESDDLGDTALKVGLRGLDITGSPVRAALAGALELATGRDVFKEDLSDIAGNIPETAELLRRAGVPEGGTIGDLPLLGGLKDTFADIGARGASGFVGDVLLDPLSLVTAGSSGLAKTSLRKGIQSASRKAPKTISVLKAALDPARAGTKKLGEKFFKSGLKQADQVLKDRGAGSISKLLIDEKITGTNSQILVKTKKLKQKLGRERDVIFKQINDSGAKVNTSNIVGPANRYIEELVNTPGFQDVAETLRKSVNNFGVDKKISVKKANDLKSKVNRVLPQNAFGQLSTDANEIRKRLAGSLRSEIRAAGNFTQKGLGSKLNKIDKKFQTLITAEKPLIKEANKGLNKNVFTSTDPANLAIGAAAGGLGGAVATLGLKKAADLAKTTGFRTGVGGLLGSDVTAPLLRSSLVNIRRPEEESLISPR